MPTFQYYDKSLGLWTGSWLDGYSTVKRSATEYVLKAPVDYNEAYRPFKVVFSLEGGTSYYNNEAGRVIFTGGTITGVTYLNEAGGALGTVTGLNVDAAAAFFHLLGNTAETQWTNFWHFVLQNHDGALYVGSNETGEKGLPWAAQIDEIDRGDDIVTSRGNDTVQAGGGSDLITDYGGADHYDGQAGAMDMVSYNAWRHMNFVSQTGIVADLRDGQIVGPDGQIDTLVSIEGVSGTRFADTMRGSAAANIFIGGAGSDIIDGRGGIDTVFYDWDRVAGIVANMATGVVIDGFGGRDRLTSIERLVGTSLRDVITDGAGNQNYDGRGGDDLFTLTKGNDTIRGGFGADTFKFIGTDFGVDRIVDYDHGEGDIIHLTGAVGMEDLTISVVGANKVISVGASQIVLVDGLNVVLDAGDFVFV